MFNYAQTGKLHFGVILGWSVVGSAAVWFVTSNLAGTPPLVLSPSLRMHAVPDSALLKTQPPALAA